jgi:hypothetical protein
MMKKQATTIFRQTIKVNKKIKTKETKLNTTKTLPKPNLWIIVPQIATSPEDYDHQLRLEIQQTSTRTRTQDKKSGRKPIQT